MKDSPALTTILTETYEDLTEQARLNDILRDKINGQAVEISALKNEIKTLQENQEILFNLYQGIKPKDEPGKTSQDRATRLDHYMDARPDHKASYEALKGFLGINDVLLNSAIAALKKEHPGKYGTIKDAADKRKRILAVIPKIS